MNVSLSDDLVDFVDQQTREEGYASSSEVVRESLRRMRGRASKKRDLLALLDAGDADIAAGRTKPLTRALLRDIANRGTRLAEEREKG